MVAQYQDTIARLLFEDADEAVTRAALDVIMPVASAVHLTRGEGLLYVVAKCDMLEIAKHLVDQHRASMLDELTVDRESPQQLAGQAGHLAVCQMLVEAGALMGIRNRRRSTSEEEARQDGHYHVTRFLQGCHHLGTRGGLVIIFAAAWADGRTVAKAE